VKIGKIVKVEFLDHSQFDDSKKPWEEQPVRCIVYGRLLKETDEYVIVLMYEELNPPDENLNNSGFVILKSTIKNVVYLREEKEER